MWQAFRCGQGRVAEPAGHTRLAQFAQCIVDAEGMIA
jgi:hypothetical protein